MKSIHIYVLVAMLAAGLGLALGLVIAPQTDWECPAPPPCAVSSVDDPPLSSAVPGKLAPAPSAQRPSFSLPGSTEAKKVIGRLEAKATLQEKLIEGMRDDKLGIPIPWRADIPPVHQQDQFEHTVSQALDEIESSLEPVDFECSEPPCISVLRGDGSQDERPQVKMSQRLHDLAISQTWQKAYGDEFSFAEFETVTCADGSTEWVLLMAPSIDALETEQEAANLKLRLKDRKGQLLSGWRCRAAGD